MFATLIGTNKGTDAHTKLAAKLGQIAVAQGFIPPDTEIRVRPNQVSLLEWQIKQLGPSNSEAEFLLAVTAPEVPTVSPIPVMKTIDGPMFSVSISPTFFGVYSDTSHEYSEFKEESDVLNAFEIFLESIKAADLSPEEHGFYVDLLFLGHLLCSNCGVKFPLKTAECADRSSLWAVTTARNALNHGWAKVVDVESVILCPQCIISHSS